MSPQQHVTLALQRTVTTPAEAFDVWPTLKHAFPGCSLLLASKQPRLSKFLPIATLDVPNFSRVLEPVAFFYLNTRVFSGNALTSLFKE
jgi:hypothetical protein